MTKPFDTHPTKYYVEADYGKNGIGNAGEDLTTEDDAADAVDGYLQLEELLKRSTRRFRVTRVDFDPDAGRAISACDVTEDIMNVIRERREEWGDDIPTLNGMTWDDEREQWT